MTYSAYQSCPHCSGSAQPGTQELLRYTLDRFPYARSLGIYSCRNVGGTGTLSIHACGRAVDVGIPTLSNGRANTALGHPIVQFFDEHSTAFGIMGQIYDRVRYDSRSPRGRFYGGVHPHYDHDHVEQVSSKAGSLTYAQIVDIAGPPTGDEMALKRGDNGRAVAEAQEAMILLWGYDLGAFTPFAGKSIYTGQPFHPGADGVYGSTMESSVVRFQKNVQLPQTGVLDALTNSYLIEGLYRIGGAGQQGPPGPQGPKGDKGDPGPSPTSATFTY